MHNIFHKKRTNTVMDGNSAKAHHNHYDDKTFFSKSSPPSHLDRGSPDQTNAREYSSEIEKNAKRKITLGVFF